MADVARKANREIGIRIRAARKTARMSQDEVAKRLRFSRNTVANIESGRRYTTLAELVAIARAVEVDPGEFIVGIVSKMGSPVFTELDYIADLLYQHNAVHVQGLATGVRWCRQSRAHREHWRDIAREAFEEWVETETRDSLADQLSTDEHVDLEEQQQ